MIKGVLKLTLLFTTILQICIVTNVNSKQLDEQKVPNILPPLTKENDPNAKNGNVNINFSPEIKVNNNVTDKATNNTNQPKEQTGNIETQAKIDNIANKQDPEVLKKSNNIDIPKPNEDGNKCSCQNTPYSQKKVIKKVEKNVIKKPVQKTVLSKKATKEEGATKVIKPQISRSPRNTMDNLAIIPVQRNKEVVAIVEKRTVQPTETLTTNKRIEQQPSATEKTQPITPTSQAVDANAIRNAKSVIIIENIFSDDPKYSNGKSTTRYVIPNGSKNNSIKKEKEGRGNNQSQKEQREIIPLNKKPNTVNNSQNINSATKYHKKFATIHKDEFVDNRDYYQIEKQKYSKEVAFVDEIYDDDIY